MEQVRKELEKINPKCKDVPILTADAHDAPSVRRVVGQGEVVLAVAGPFARHGDNVVAASVEEGTHYADITGEVSWVKRSVARHHAAAASKGVKVLHCCGYDSVPSDLGTYMMVAHCREQLGCGASQAYTLVVPGKGGVSGGTIESAFNLAATEGASEMSAMMSDQYYLAAAHGLSSGPDKPAGIMPRYIPAAQSWSGPWLMEGVNAKVVQATNALLARCTTMQYGKDFKYTEAMAVGGAVGAAMLSAFMVLVGAVVGLPPLRALARRFLPAPGQGPSEEARVTGYWRHELVAVTDEPQPRVVKGHCGDRRDCGYWSTSRMLLETGLALVLEAPRLAREAAAGRIHGGGGVLTPAAACGPVLLDRLRAAGFEFSVDSVDGKLVQQQQQQVQEAPQPAAAAQ